MQSQKGVFRPIALNRAVRCGDRRCVRSARTRPPGMLYPHLAIDVLLGHRSHAASSDAFAGAFFVPFSTVITRGTIATTSTGASSGVSGCA